MGKIKDYLAFIGSMLLFGTNGLLVTSIPLSSAQIVLTRTLLGTFFLLAVSLAKKEFSIRQYKADLVPVLVSGLCLGANWIFLFDAYRYASVSIGTLVYYTGPILVMALSPVLFKEKLTWNKLAAIAAVVTGMLCITGVAELGGGGAARGLGSALVAAVLYALLIISNKSMRHVQGLSATLSSLFISSIVVGGYLLGTGGLPFAIPAGKPLVCVIVLGVVNTGIACWLYFSSMRRLPGQTVALCCYVDPLSAVVFSALFLGERMTPVQGIGAALLLGGALFGELKWGQRAAAKA